MGLSSTQNANNKWLHKKSEVDVTSCHINLGPFQTNGFNVLQSKTTSEQCFQVLQKQHFCGAIEQFK